ncbi:NUC169 domain-containing protein, partial [Pavlovales sp. CCMP2436]
MAREVAKRVGGKRGRVAAEESAGAEPDAAVATAAPVEAEPEPEVPDDGSDSEDDGIRNMVGDVPLEWYDDYEHIGYGIDGAKFGRPPQRDELDALIERYDKGNSRTVYDALHGEMVELTDDDVGILRRIQNNNFPDLNFDPYPDTIPWVSSVLEKEPLWQHPEPKSRFLPSRWERKRIIKLVRAMRSEAYQKQLAANEVAKEKQRPDYNYAIWDETLEDLTREQRRVMYKRLNAPKIAPPTNAESYNPPPEYLLTTEEEAEWLEMDPEDRPTNFIPKQYDCLRRTPAYEALAAERFQRCLDLYLCPRTQRTKLNIDPDSLLPQLPDLSQLEPYPKRLSASFVTENGAIVRTLAVHPGGQWLATGSDDGLVRVWEVSTGRCVLDWALGAPPAAGSAKEGKEGKAEAEAAPEPIHRLAFCPAAGRTLLAASVGSRVLLVSLPMLLPPRGAAGSTLRPEDEAAVGAPVAAAGASVIEWCHERPASPPSVRAGRPPNEALSSLALAVPHAKAVRQLAWHPRGDYLCTVVPDGGAKAVLLHQISRRVSQQPFAKSKGRVEAALFHPSRPQLFVATQREVRVYDLLKQALLKKLSSDVQWISSMAIHPGGDNLIIGSYDKRVVWFDLDLSAKPYQALR